MTEHLQNSFNLTDKDRTN